MTVFVSSQFRRFGIVLTLLLGSCASVPVETEHPPAKAAARQPEVRHDFDFYVLSLSWSPGFCATSAGRNDPQQCGPDRHFAFVLHGLWPQYERSGWPENCSTAKVDEETVERMLTIMPSRPLVRHEWEKHGTCSGLSGEAYFTQAADAFRGIRIPARYQAPERQIVVDPDELHQEFAAANPGIGADGFVVLCSGNGRYLQEVRACLRTDLKGRACNREVERDACRSRQVVMRPVR
jgi:ribonuclease T2